MLTLRAINNELKARGHSLELVRGDGYFYVDGPGCESWFATMIVVWRINHLSMPQWIAAVESLMPAKRTE